MHLLLHIIVFIMPDTGVLDQSFLFFGDLVFLAKNERSSRG